MAISQAWYSLERQPFKVNYPITDKMGARPLWAKF